MNSDIFSVVPIEFVYTGFEQELLKVYTPNDEEYKVEYNAMSLNRRVDFM